VSEFRLEKNPDAKAVPKRIALIRREAPARLLEDREELVMSAPHLLVREVILVQICLIALALASLLFDAPLEGIADPSNTPNPAKAPWYFLGLQELLHYFPPVVAGVLLPALALIGVVVIPYFRINLENAGFYERPWRRTLAALFSLTAVVSGILIAYRVWAVLAPTLAIFLLLALPALPYCPASWRQRLSRVPLSNWIMTWFVCVAAILTLIGVLFRGPGWTWVWPWRDGIY
jgi:quinol-cytochrome oxidoreductase complex cytochrome b subunit